jgi:hypothetical protein
MQQNEGFSAVLTGIIKCEETETKDKYKLETDIRTDLASYLVHLNVRKVPKRRFIIALDKSADMKKDRRLKTASFAIQDLLSSP